MHARPPPIPVFKDADGTERRRPPTSKRALASEHELLPPSRLIDRLLGEHYRVTGLLGEGGIAQVFAAVDTRNDTPVAVKVLAKSRRPSPDLQERLIQEAAITTRIDHPHVIRVHDAGEKDGHPYMVMEALSGETLHERLARDGPLGAPEVLRFAREAALGLAAAHREGIIHRDVKPRNLFLCGPIGKPEKLKVFDFGFAGTVTEGPAAGRVLGTLEYMAPEQIISEPVDARADVYSLGVVMFRMLTQELPFDTGPRPQIIAHQLLSVAPPPSWLVDDLNPQLERIILTAMRKSPANRYATMLDMLEDLERLSEGRDIVGAPLIRQPDHYHPVTELGRSAVQLLQMRHGSV